MGACLATTKIIGTASLGILTGALGQQAFGSVPLVIQLAKSSPLSDLQEAISKIVSKTRLLLLSFGSVATSLLSMAFFKAPARARHPYLIYAALGAPLALATLFFNNYDAEAKLLDTRSSYTSKESKKVVEGSSKKEEPSQLDNSVYQNLGADSEDDSNSNTTPDEQDIEAEVNSSIYKTNSSVGLQKIKFGYSLATYIVGLAFGISTVGIYGDFS